MDGCKYLVLPFFPSFFFLNLFPKTNLLSTRSPPPNTHPCTQRGMLSKGRVLRQGEGGAKKIPLVRQTEGCNRPPIPRLLPHLVPSPHGKASTCLSAPPGESISGWFTQHRCKQHVDEVGFPSISLPSPEEKAAGPRENLSRKSNSALFFFPRNVASSLM